MSRRALEILPLTSASNIILNSARCRPRNTKFLIKIRNLINILKKLKETKQKIFGTRFSVKTYVLLERKMPLFEKYHTVLINQQKKYAYIWSPLHGYERAMTFIRFINP